MLVGNKIPRLWDFETFARSENLMKNHEWIMTKRYTATLGAGESLVYLPGLKTQGQIVDTPAFDGAIYKDGRPIAAYSAKKLKDTTFLVLTVEKAVEKARTYSDIQSWAELPGKLIKKRLSPEPVDRTKNPLAHTDPVPTISTPQWRDFFDPDASGSS